VSDDIIVGTTRELTKIFRVALKSAVALCSPDTVLTFERCWKALIYVLDTALLANEDRID
jgi:septal ring factor EnvC (AmiA/AmiB activator)